MKEESTNQKKSKSVPEKERLALDFASSIINSTSDAVIATNLKGEITLWNNGATVLYGYTREEALGKNISFVYRKEDLPELGSRIQNVIQGKVISNAEVIIIDKYKNEYTVLLTLNGLKNENGEIDQLVGLTKNITETKLAEQALKESEQKFSQAFDNSPIPISILNLKNGKRLAVNNAFSKTFGYSKADLINGVNIHKINLAVDQKEFKLTAKKILDEGNIFEHPFSMYTKSGEVRQVLLNATRAYDNNDDIYITSYLDVTEYKKAENALESSEKKFRNLAKTAQVAIAILREPPENRFIYVNQYWEKLTGYTSKEAEKLSAMDLIAPEFHKVLTKEAIKGQSMRMPSDRNEFKIITKSGETKWVNFTATSIEFDGEKAVLRTGLDITEHKKNEQKLLHAKENAQKSENYLHNIINNIGDPVFVKDEQGKFLLVNNTFCNFLDLTRDDIIGKTLAEDIPPKEQEIFLKIDRQVLETGKENINEESLTLRGKETKTIITKKTRYIDNNGKKHLIGVIRDITSQKNTERELKKAQQIASVGNWYLDVLTEEIVYSDELYKMYGFDPTLPIPSYSEHEKYFTPESWQLLNSSIEKTRNTGIPYAIELKTNEKIGNDSWEWMWAQGEAVFDSENKIIAVRGTAQDITERKKTEDALRSSEKKFRILAETAQVSIAILREASGKGYVYVNPYWEELTGYSSKEAQKLDILDLVAPEYHAMVTEKATKKLSGRKTLDKNELKLITKSGEAKWVSFTSINIDFEGKKSILRTALDITEKKLSEEALKDSEKKLKAILDHHFQLTALLDIEGRLLTVNKTALEFIGKKEKDVLGKYFWDNPWWETSQKTLVSSAIEKAAKGQFIRFETTHINKLREIRKFDFSLNPVFDDDGNVIYIVPEGRDITESKKAEERIIESEEKYRTLFEQSMVGIGLGRGNDIVFGNKAMMAIWKYDSLEEYKKKPLIEHIAPEYRELIQYRIKEGLSNKGKNLPAEYEYDIICRDGEIKNVRGHTSYIQIGDEIYSQTVVIDVTQRVKHEKELLLAKNILEESKTKFEILSNVTFEGILIHDKGVPVDLNNSFPKMFGYTKDEFLNKDLVKLIINKEYQNIVLDNIKNEYQLPYEVIGIKKDGTEFPIEIEGKTYISEDNKKLRVTAIRDITDRKKAEVKLEQANLELRDAVSSLNELKKQLENQNIYLKKELDLVFNFEEMVYGSAVFGEVLTDLERVAPTDATVLILGESGTGKELLARALHNLSLRKDKPFIKVNCSAIPSELIESELFGHKKGSFTGAVADKVGKFQLADGGTLFLDEIGDLPLAMQPKLLRFLQEGEMEVVGGTTTKALNVRIVAATNKNLKEGVNKAEFREDLYFRLNVFPIQVPPLRERKEDIPLLVEHFLDKFGKKYRKSIKYIADSAMQDMRTHRWPGNIRELENLVERSVILSDSETLSLPGFGSHKSKKSKISTDTQLTLNDVQRNHILSVLEKTNWKVDGPDGAALILDIKPSTFRDKMKKLGIKRPD